MNEINKSHKITRNKGGAAGGSGRGLAGGEGGGKGGMCGVGGPSVSPPRATGGGSGVFFFFYLPSPTSYLSVSRL